MPGREAEHAFHVVKRLWRFTKVRYRGFGEEHRPTVHRLRPGEPVSAAATVDHATGDVSLVNAERAASTADPKLILGRKPALICLFA